MMILSTKQSAPYRAINRALSAPQSTANLAEPGAVSCGAISPRSRHGFDDLLERFAAAAAASDTAGFAALFTADGSYDDGFFGLHRGREAIAAMLARFYVGGERFHWKFFEPLANERLGYTRYCFSYRSKEKERRGPSGGVRGHGPLAVAQGLIADYAEVFDRGWRSCSWATTRRGCTSCWAVCAGVARGRCGARASALA
jgi:hypothetical protein